MRGFEMDELEKMAIRLKHWIGHNLEHVKAYESAEQQMKELGLTDAANNMSQAVDFSSKANEKFESALRAIESKVAKHIEYSGTQESSHCDTFHGPHGHEHVENGHRHS